MTADPTTVAGSARPGIIWISSYPKSGSTWLRLALASLRRGGAPVRINGFKEGQEIPGANRPLFDRLCDVDSSDLPADVVLAARPHMFRMVAAGLSHNVFCKVHDAFVRVGDGSFLFPPQVTVGAVHVCRDPRDVAVSLAHHMGITIDAAIGTMADPRYGRFETRPGLSRGLPQAILTWSANIDSWCDTAAFPVTLLRYEDMHADPVTTLARAARAAAMPAASDALRHACAATRFDVLRDQEQAEGFDETPPTARSFFRSGTAGGWRDVLSRAQQNRILRDHGATMARLGYV